MESLYLLIPLSAALVLLILGIFGWAVYRGQFEDLDGEAERILDADRLQVDADQVAQSVGTEESSHRSGSV